MQLKFSRFFSCFQGDILLPIPGDPRFCTKGCFFDPAPSYPSLLSWTEGVSRSPARVHGNHTSLKTHILLRAKHTIGAASKSLLATDCLTFGFARWECEFLRMRKRSEQTIVTKMDDSKGRCRTDVLLRDGNNGKCVGRIWKRTSRFIGNKYICQLMISCSHRGKRIKKVDHIPTSVSFAKIYYYRTVILILCLYFYAVLLRFEGWTVMTNKKLIILPAATLRFRLQSPRRR